MVVAWVCLGISAAVSICSRSPPCSHGSKLAPQSCVDVSYLGKVWRHIVVWSVTASAFGHNIGCHSCWVSIAGCACYIRVICTAWLLKAFAVRMSRHFVNSESMVYLAARCKGFEISTTSILPKYCTMVKSHWRWAICAEKSKRYNQS